MKFIRIPKGHGKFRTICLPSPEEKEANRKWIVPVNEILSNLWIPYSKGDHYNIPIHGFRKNCSPVTNALKHRGHRFTLCFDLKDFFDTVRLAHVTRHFLEYKWRELANECFFERDDNRNAFLNLDSVEHRDLAGGALTCNYVTVLNSFTSKAYPVQGLPASPAISNLAATAMDMAILTLIKQGRFGETFVYTRYCDDLTFSFDTPDIGKMLMVEVPRIVTSHGFMVNESKTRSQCADAGRRIITGVSVGNDLRMTRKTRRRIRAARHQIRTRISGRNRARLAAIARERKASGDTVSLHGLLVSGYRGLKEWSLLRKPKGWEKPPSPVVFTQRVVARSASTGISQSAAVSVPTTNERNLSE